MGPTPLERRWQVGHNTPDHPVGEAFGQTVRMELDLFKVWRSNLEFNKQDMTSPYLLIPILSE